ncbi:hypothetical protein [Vagococcus intermedius]|uniref:Uncharacterized protein n=1 Tax=Vagococcus intermedius TaxID=2991418 RepID=A0AAF0CVG0_9ENTE|nr:hypothetical protein [Vagococcus intermedius]WEG73596.1 hypothetical protein OL234_01440 [Vagococcus intermedius]WEG75680.1 hypothetical protein OL235_01450 [Vagococcus intermedius]
MNEQYFSDYMSFDIVFKSKIGNITRKMIFPISYTEEDVRVELEKKQPELMIEDIFEAEYVLQLKA